MMVEGEAKECKVKKDFNYCNRGSTRSHKKKHVKAQEDLCGF
jgi:hypothetical protein